MLNDRLFYQETSVCIDLKVLFPSAELTPRISGLGSSVALSQARIFCAQTLQLKLLKSEGNQKTSQIPEEILWSQSLQDFGNGDNTTHSKVCIIAVCVVVVLDGGVVWRDQQARKFSCGSVVQHVREIKETEENLFSQSRISTLFPLCRDADHCVHLLHRCDTLNRHSKH